MDDTKHSLRKIYIDNIDMPLFIVTSLIGVAIGALCTVIMAGVDALSWAGAGRLMLAATVLQTAWMVCEAPTGDENRMPAWRGKLVVLGIIAVATLAALVVPRVMG